MNSQISTSEQLAQLKAIVVDKCGENERVEDVPANVLIYLANKNGLYDAADLITYRIAVGKSNNLLEY